MRTSTLARPLLFGRRRWPARKVATAAVTHGLMSAGALLFMLPFLWMLSTSLKHEWQAYQIPPQWIPGELVWSNYADALFKYFNFLRYLANTLLITLGVLVGRVLTASLVAFGFARTRFPGRDVLFLVVLGTMMIPHHATIIPLYVIFKELGWLNTYLPLIVPAWLGGGAFFVFLVRQFILTIPPELDDAARIDGCSWFGIYRRIVLPLIVPALGAVAIFSVLFTWNDFFHPLIFLRDNSLYTLAIGMYFYTNSPTNRPETTVTMAGATLMLIPPLLLFFAAQRYFIQGVVFSGLKG